MKRGKRLRVKRARWVVTREPYRTKIPRDERAVSAEADAAVRQLEAEFLETWELGDMTKMVADQISADLERYGYRGRPTNLLAPDWYDAALASLGISRLDNPVETACRRNIAEREAEWRRLGLTK